MQRCCGGQWLTHIEIPVPCLAWKPRYIRLWSSSSLAKCSCMYEYRECQARSRCTASLSCGQFSYHFVTFGCRLAAVGQPAAFRGQPRYFKADADWSSLGPSLGPSQRVWFKRVEGSQMMRGSMVKCLGSRT